VVSVQDLPAEWSSPDTEQDVSDIIDIFREFNKQIGTSLNFRLLTYTPPANTVRFEIVVDMPVGRPLPVAYLGALDLLRGSEVVRVANDEAVKSTEIATVENALTAGLPRALLAPDTRYTISVDYLAEVRQTDPKSPRKFTTSPFPATQRYTFI